MAQLFFFAKYRCAKKSLNIQLKSASLNKKTSISIVIIFRLCYSFYLWSIRCVTDQVLKSKSQKVKKSLDPRPMIYFAHERATCVRIYYSFTYYIIVIKARLMCLWPSFLHWPPFLHYPYCAVNVPLEVEDMLLSWARILQRKNNLPLHVFLIFFPFAKAEKSLLFSGRYLLAENIKIQYLALKSNPSRKRQSPFLDLNELNER